jgi:protein-disulfide isomerase
LLYGTIRQNLRDENVTKKKPPKRKDSQNQSMFNLPVILGIVLAAVIVTVVLILADRQGNRSIIVPESHDYSLANANMIGQENAPVVMVEYSDFQCRFCGQFREESFPGIFENYIETGKVLFIYRHYTILGPPSFRAAKASLCANEHGQFWPYHDYLFANQDESDSGAFSSSRLELFAEDIGLDVDSFRACLIDDRMDGQIDADFGAARDAGAESTPTFIINGKLIRGAQGYNVFVDEIEAALAAVDDPPAP